jgi:pantoate--beta-alanine ligase
MRIVRSIQSMQRLAMGWRKESVRVGLVPTMGYLHDGHISLVRRARHAVGDNGRVVLSIYVNPTQFGPGEDLSDYPRDFDRDKELCSEAGVDVVFAPPDEGMYSRGQQAHSTYVMEETLSPVMEGASRPTHFRGVTTVVAKLFNLVLPDVAVFGQKDFQQAAVIRRMVRDLNFPVRILVASTVREADGLAMSSRNKYLTPEERRQSVVLWEAIRMARGRVRGNAGGLPARNLADELGDLIGRCPSARVDYIAFFDPASLQPVTRVKPGAHIALAVFIGRTRLIDNASL